MPIASWNTVRLYGTWVNYDGTKKAGSYRVDMPVRVVNRTDDVIIPAGTFKEGPLNTQAGSPSFDLRIPATDDPDNTPSGFQPVLTISFTDGSAAEKYLLTLPVAMSADPDGIDLINVSYPSNAIGVQTFAIVIDGGKP